MSVNQWRMAKNVVLQPDHKSLNILFANNDVGAFCWAIIGDTLQYAANLVPEISDNIINIDRAMRWGFSWKMGPFELIDAIGPLKLINRLNATGRKLPYMLSVLEKNNYATFYINDKSMVLGIDGIYHPIPKQT